jgi:malonyl-CoA/methylmalonyl-CoA synthetase
MSALFPPLDRPTSEIAFHFRAADATLTWRELRDLVASLSHDLAGSTRVAVWAEPTIETAIAVIGALVSGVTAVPINPSIGHVELAHMLGECQPDAVLAAPDAVLPDALAARTVLHVRSSARGSAAASTSRAGSPASALPRPRLPPPPDAEAPALIIYTSGTTGPPKGAVLPYRALTAEIDGLARVWQWTARDTLVHALPLFHVHGLVLGTLGPARVGSRLVHAGRFSPEGLASALIEHDATMLFGVPTMYHRLAEGAEEDEQIVRALRQPRLLISGSAPLAARDRDRLQRCTGRHVIERYGLTETLIVSAMPPDCAADATGVGMPIPGVRMRLVDEHGTPLPADTGATDAAATDAHATDVLGEIEVSGPTVFSGYLNRPDATAHVLRDGWFRTGDTAVRDATGFYRIIGRTALDVIKTGGFKVGAGEIEDVLRAHPHVADVAVTGESDPDLGQRIVAWIVAREGCDPSPAALEACVADALAPHKRPRVIHFVPDLPRNSMGKVEKRKLTPPNAG